MFKKIKNNFYTFLRSGEKYTRTDNVYLAKSWTSLNAGNVTSAIVAFGLSIAFAHFLNKDAFGQYKFILSVVSLLSITSLQEINSLVVQGVARGQEKVFLSGLRIKIRWTFLGSLGSLILAGYYFIHANLLLAAAFAVIAPLLPIFANFNLYLSYLQGKKMFARQTLYFVGAQIFSSLAIVGTMFFFKNPLVLVVVYFVAYSLARIYLLRRVLKKFPPNQKDNPEILRFGKNMSFIGILSDIAANINNIIVFHFLGAPAVAIFTFAQAPINQMRTVLKNLRTIALPKLVNLSRQEIRATFLPKIWRLVLLILLIIAGYNLVVRWIFEFFFPQYTESILLSRILVFGLLTIPATMIPLALQAKEMKQELYQMSAFIPVIKIVLFLVLIPKFGLFGLAGTEVAMALVYGLLSWIYFLKI